MAIAPNKSEELFLAGLSETCVIIAQIFLGEKMNCVIIVERRASSANLIG